MGIAHTAAVQRLLGQANDDPLERYRCAAWFQRTLVEAWVKGGRLPPEGLIHSGNSGSKTTGGLAVTLALLQGREYLTDWDGSRILLPQIPPPVSWVLGVESYKLAAESTLPKLREMIGHWPHHESRAGGPDSVVKFTVRHRKSRDDSDSRADWSRLAVFSYEGPEPEAMRLDGWQCDEPAPTLFIDALRNRGKAGRALYGFHTLTPIRRSQWEPIFGDFPTEHRVVRKNRLRLQSSVYDNRALHVPGCDGKCAGTGRCPDITRAEAAVATSPYRLARLYGEPVDISGTCPFDTEELLARRDLCESGTRYAVQWAQREGQPTLWPVQHAKGQLEVWDWPGRFDRCVIVADPSSGVREPDTPDHLQPRNPSGLVGLSLERQCEYVRFNGYVPAHELGQMARAVCNRSPNWVLVVETNGGWGDAFLSGFRSAPSVAKGELWYETDPDTGKVATEPGWKQSAPKLGLLLSALQRSTEPGGLKFKSRAAVDNFLRTRLDANERWDRGDGKGPHGEDVIVYGIGAYVLERSTLPRRPSGMELVTGKLSVRTPSPEAGIAERW